MFKQSCEIVQLLCFHFWLRSEVQLPLVLPSLRFINAREKLTSVNQADPKALKFHLILKVTYVVNRAWLLAHVRVVLSRVV